LFLLLLTFASGDDVSVASPSRSSPAASVSSGSSGGGGNARRDPHGCSILRFLSVCLSLSDDVSCKCVVFFVVLEREKEAKCEGIIEAREGADGRDETTHEVEVFYPLLPHKKKIATRGPGVIRRHANTRHHR